MRTLYLDCGMGAAGDMLTASLLQLFSEPVKQVKKLNDLKIPGVKYQLVACTRCGIRGYQVRVFVKGQEEENLHMQTEEHVGHKSEETEKHTQEHGHHSMSQIVRLINRLEIEDQVKQDAVAVYKLIAKAEGKAHGQRMDEIHFHEVGTMDAVADVVAVCYLLNCITGSCRIWSGEMCTWNPSGAGTGNSVSYERNSNVCRKSGGRILYTDRSCTSEAFC